MMIEEGDYDDEDYDYDYGESIEELVARARSEAAASGADRREGGLTEAQVAARVVGRHLRALVTDRSRAGVDRGTVGVVVGAIKALRRRRAFCEGTFRNALGLKDVGGRLPPLLLWELSGAGVVSWSDHVSSLDVEGVLNLPGEPRGAVMRRLVELSGDLGDGEGAENDHLRALNALRELWRTAPPGRGPAVEAALAATEEETFPRPLFNLFWANELNHCFQAGGEMLAWQTPSTFQRICKKVLPGASEELLPILRRALAACGSRTDLEGIAFCVSIMLEKSDARALQDLFFGMGAGAIQSGATSILSNVLLCNQIALELLPTASGEGENFKSWLTDYLQRQVNGCKSSALGFNSAKLTQMILKVFTEFVPQESPKTLMIHKEVMKMLDGLNESYVRDYCNLVQARLHDFEIPDRQMKAFRSQFSSMP
ncbi:hypothetical protein HOP50_03g25820 [Chloropicon primus]|nr:hypothetical protein HOP50_03g25820 [Chloropicon primus]